MGIADKWNNFQPSKGALAWTAIGASVLTMIVGFSWGGWVTGGSADTMVAQARENAREQLVASICVDRFVAAPNAANKLVALKEASTWERDDFIEKGGWAKIAALEEQVSGAADLCAEKLAEMEGLPERAVGEPTASAG